MEEIWQYVTEIDVELYDILIPKAEAGKSSPLILHSTPQEPNWYFFMAMKSGLIRIKPEYLRWAMKRDDLWMARYFLLKKSCSMAGWITSMSGTCRRTIYTT